MSNKDYYGIRIKFEGNVLYSNSGRTTEENLALAKKALATLLNVHEAALFAERPLDSNVSFFERNGGIVERLRSYGSDKEIEVVESARS